MILTNLPNRIFNGLASIAFAVPLLILITAATILGTIIPQGKNVSLPASLPELLHGLNGYLQLNNIFYSWWYLLLLALLGVSLLAITIKRVPVVWRQKGRGTALAILLAHLGILLILAGAVYGNIAGFRYYVRLIEGDVKVMPGLPFAIKLDRFDLEYYPEDATAGEGMRPRVARRQDSALSLLKHGSVFMQTTTAPGQPLEVRGMTLLPSQTDTGWAFSLVVTDPRGREKVVPVLPWAPELVRLGLTRQSVFAHKVVVSENAKSSGKNITKPDSTEVFLLEVGKEPLPVGIASEAAPLVVSNYTVTPWNIRPYTGLHIYHRPGTHLLIAGFVCLMTGLLITLYKRRITLVSTPVLPPPGNTS